MDRLTALSSSSDNSTLVAEFEGLTVSLHALDTYAGFKGSSLKASFAEANNTFFLFLFKIFLRPKSLQLD